jgi:glucan phosphoethanolaminetransferase (alkaline phosphatase superfamily)
MKEFIRKRIVYLKRHPQFIPFLFAVISCLTFTFNMTNFSDTMMYLSENQYIAFNMFLITLSSFMSVLLLAGSLKRLNKTSIIMIIICCALAALQIALDILFIQGAHHQLYVRENPVPMKPFLQTAIDISYVHIVLLAIFILSAVLLPVYSRLLKKINTQTQEEIALRSMAALDDGDKLDLTEEI